MIKNKEELKKLLQAQNQLVVIDNQHIQKHCNTLSRLESTTLAWPISKIKPNDKPSMRYTVDCDELLAIMGWTNMRYRSVKDAMEGLSKAKWWLIDSAVKNQGYIIFEEVSYDPRLLYVWFLPSTHMHLFQLNKVHASAKEPLRVKAFTTSYPLAYHSVMSCRYSIRIYELLKSYINKGHWIFEFGTGSHMDIQHLLAQWHSEDGVTFTLPSSWKNWGYFQRDVLVPAQEDLKKYTDITFTYDGLAHDMARHTTRSVRCIRFKIHLKTEAEKEEAARAINAKYRDYIDAWAAKHLSNKLDRNEVSIDADIFTYKTSVNKSLPSSDDQSDSYEEDDFSAASHSDNTDSMDFAMLYEDIDPADLPF